MNPVHTLQSGVFPIYFRTYQAALSFMFTHQNSENTFVLAYACRTPRPSYLP
jgi:hypothetical protein